MCGSWHPHQFACEQQTRIHPIHLILQSVSPTQRFCTRTFLHPNCVAVSLALLQFPLGTYTSLTVLNSSFEARAISFLGSASSRSSDLTALGAPAESGVDFA